MCLQRRAWRSPTRKESSNTVTRGHITRSSQAAPQSPLTHTQKLSTTTDNAWFKRLACTQNGNFELSNLTVNVLLYVKFSDNDRVSACSVAR